MPIVRIDPSATCPPSKTTTDLAPQVQMHHDRASRPSSFKIKDPADGAAGSTPLVREKSNSPETNGNGPSAGAQQGISYTLQARGSQPRRGRIVAPPFPPSH